MKLEQLLEAPKTGYYRDKKVLIGRATNWLDDAGISKEDIAQVIPKIKSSPEFKKILDLGFDYTSGKIQEKQGTLQFTSGPTATVKINRRAPGAGGPGKVSYIIYVNGQVRYTNVRGSQTRLATPKPALVHGNPTASLTKIYTRALNDLHDRILAVFKKEHPDQRLATALKISVDELKQLQAGDEHVERKVAKNIEKIISKDHWKAERVLNVLKKNKIQLPQEKELLKKLNLKVISSALRITVQEVEKLLSGSVEAQASFVEQAKKHPYSIKDIVKNTKKHFKLDPRIERELDEAVRDAEITDLARLLGGNKHTIADAIAGDKKAQESFVRLLLLKVKNERGERPLPIRIINGVKQLGLDLPEFKTIEKHLK